MELCAKSQQEFWWTQPRSARTTGANARAISKASWIVAKSSISEPFLLDLAMAILGRVSLYQSEVLPNQESTPLASRKFRVWFHAHATSPGTTEGLGGQDQRDLEDMGLCEICGVEESLSHITTFTSCSCQRERKWGVFCVHMGLVYVNNNVARIPEGVVHKAWLPQADKEKSCTDEVMQRLLDDMEGISIERATQAG